MGCEGDIRVLSPLARDTQGRWSWYDRKVTMVEAEGVWELDFGNWYRQAARFVLRGYTRPPQCELGRLCRLGGCLSSWSDGSLGRSKGSHIGHRVH